MLAYDKEDQLAITDIDDQSTKYSDNSPAQQLEEIEEE